jgi:hypothetical protein
MLATFNPTSHPCRNPFHPNVESEDVPRTVYCVIGKDIKRGVLLRVPQPVTGSPYIGKIGLQTGECFVPMYRVFEDELSAWKLLDLMERR